MSALPSIADILRLPANVGSVPAADVGTWLGALCASHSLRRLPSDCVRRPWLNKALVPFFNSALWSYPTCPAIQRAERHAGCWGHGGQTRGICVKRSICLALALGVLLGIGAK